MNSFDRKVLDKLADEVNANCNWDELTWLEYPEKRRIARVVELARLEFEKKIEEMQLVPKWAGHSLSEYQQGWDKALERLRCFLREKEEGEKQNGQKR